MYPNAVAGAQPKPGPCAVVDVGGDGPAAHRACGKRSRGVPHTRTVGSGRGGDRPASQLAVSGRSSRGPFGNGDAKGSLRPPPQCARSRGQPMEAFKPSLAGQAKSSQAEPSAPWAAAGAHTCAAHAGRGTPAIAERMKQTPGRRRAPRHAPQARGDPHRPPMAPASPGRAHTAATLRAVKSSQVKWCSKTPGVLVFINTGGHAMRRIVPSRDIQHGPCAQGSASAGTCARGVRARAPLSARAAYGRARLSPRAGPNRMAE